MTGQMQVLDQTTGLLSVSGQNGQTLIQQLPLGSGSVSMLQIPQIHTISADGTIVTFGTTNENIPLTINQLNGEPLMTQLVTKTEMKAEGQEEPTANQPLTSQTRVSRRGRKPKYLVEEGADARQSACRDCGKIYTKISQLRAHERTHTGMNLLSFHCLLFYLKYWISMSDLYDLLT